MDRIKIEELYKEHRPIVHFTCRLGWMNDPNGLIFHEGWYHMFYQYYPDGVTHGPMHWGHARTKDFLKWEELAIALWPDENGMIFSGSMVYDKDNTSGLGTKEQPPLVAVFTHHLDKEGKSVETQSLAYSVDGGETFLKYEGNPVLDCGLRDFRDPKVFWYAHTEKWIMLTAAGQAVRFFTSPDLKTWEAGCVFRVDGLEPDVIWECPDLVELSDGQGEKRWVLFVSQNTNDYLDTGVRYFTGFFDGKGFYAETGIHRPLFVDFGRDNYAAATYAGVQGRVVQQSWMNCWVYAAKLPETGFRGSMTLPRELGLLKTVDGYRITQKPVREALEKLCMTEYEISVKTTLPVEHIPGIYHFLLTEDTAKLAFCNQNNALKLVVDFTYGKIIVDRSGCDGLVYGACYQELRRAYFHRQEKRELYVILDVTSLEVFTADGEAVGTFQYFVDEPFTCVRVGGTK